MNSEINKKTPAFIYAKEFKLSKILGNLQAYKLATGNVGQTEQEEATRKHGNNLGSLYGSLITNASITTKSKKRTQNEGVESSTKRCRRKKEKEESRRQYPVPSVTPGSLNEPLTIPESLLKEEEDSSRVSSAGESSESSDNEIVDFLGLSTAQDDESSSEESCRNDIEKTSTRCLSERRFNASNSSKEIYGGTEKPLTTYSCSRCHRRGHLTEHCTILGTDKHHQSNANKTSHQRSNLHDLFLQCRKLKRSRNANCSACGNKSNLAFCFECRLTFCDGRGHLIEHLLNFPTHTKLYSHKLQKLLKCCNPSCEVVDVDQLLVCSQCLSKIFDKQYSLINATWSGRGLRAILNVLCCEEHFQWHRMNCYNSSEEILFCRDNLMKLKHEQSGLMSEFFF